MGVSQFDADPPEQFIRHLLKKLRQHAVWDVLLMFVPPLAAIVYCLFYLYSTSAIALATVTLAASAALIAGAAAAALRCRPNLPSAHFAARLIDDRAGAQDRFLTLATLEPAPEAAPLRARLRAEAAALQTRISLKREFPYRVKRPFYTSLMVSILGAALFQLLLPVAHSSLRSESATERLRKLAGKMITRSELQQVARSLEELARKLENPTVSVEQKREAVQQQRKALDKTKTDRLEQQDRDLLADASSTLESIERQSGAGERDQEQQGGGGSIQTNLPQQGQGGRQEQQARGGAGQNDGAAETDNDVREGKLASTDSMEQAEGKAARDGGTGSSQKPDPSKPPQDKTDTQQPGKSDGPGADRNGRSKASEEIPQSGPPAERFYKPGEGGYQGIKGAGYVTVQLPEELLSETKVGSNKGNKHGKTAASQVPVSNVPLPSHVPDAPSEKQQMPLEYRDIIR
jgi:hypothetical protein